MTDAPYNVAGITAMTTGDLSLYFIINNRFLEVRVDYLSLI